MFYSVPKIVSHISGVHYIFGHIFKSNLNCFAHSHYSMYIFCTCSYSRFLFASMHKYCWLYTISYIQETTALSSSKLMRTCTHHINIHLFYINLCMKICLNCICMKTYIISVSNLSYAFNRLYTANFIISTHYAY